MEVGRKEAIHYSPLYQIYILLIIYQDGIEHPHTGVPAKERVASDASTPNLQEETAIATDSSAELLAKNYSIQDMHL